MNIKTFTVASFELTNGHILRRATEVEIDRIRRFCHSENIHSLWEYPLPNGGNLLPKNDWRYFVIDFPGNDDVLRDLRVAFDLSSKELEIGFWFMDTGTGAVFHPERFRYVAGGGNGLLPPIEFFVDISLPDLEQSKAIFHRVHSLVEKDPLRPLLLRLGHLKTLPPRSSVQFLGYVSFLEAMLTHKPKHKDHSDSLTRQITHKIIELDHRWTTPLDYSPLGKRVLKRSGVQCMHTAVLLPMGKHRISKVTTNLKYS
jgi:hypothetical protein